ncbi:MAG: ECF transporter S component [Candidatus Nealsonbacteria bacterium]
MILTKVLTIKKDIVLTIAQFAVLMVIATVVPILGHNQAITGPIVNAVLLISAVLLGPQGAVLVGLIPSVVALSAGLLPLPLAPMVPFIMISNTILILTFACLRRKNFWLGIAAASALKFIFLVSTSTVVMNLIAKQEIARKAALMMSWPQFLTALGGGVIAYFLLKSLKKI